MSDNVKLWVYGFFVGAKIAVLYILLLDAVAELFEMRG